MSALLQALAATMAIVTQDQSALRAGPRESTAQQAVLWQGDTLEVRGQRQDYLQVWDHRRERGGWVRASQVRTTTLQPADADELRAVLRFLRDTPGAEALGIAYVAAYLQAVPVERLDAEPFDTLGTLAERLARRAATRPGLATPAAVAAHLEVAAQYGVRIAGIERQAVMQPCYDGEAWRRVLALPAQPAQRARAALGLTAHECVDPALPPAQRLPLDQWRARVLDSLSPAEEAALAPALKGRLQVRRAGVWASLAHQHARRGDTAAAGAAGARALQALTAVDKGELTDADLRDYDDAALRVGASRWAAAGTAAQPQATPALVVGTEAGEPGQTCVVLRSARAPADTPLARRCTWGQVWLASAQVQPQGQAVALAVQPLDTWRELWLFRRQGAQWTVDVLPPDTRGPETGYAEFAGWVPGGRQLLVVREARVEGRTTRRFEVLGLDTLAPQRWAQSPELLVQFSRWQDPAWKRQTVALR